MSIGVYLCEFIPYILVKNISKHMYIMSVWLQVFDFYRYHCENNADFLRKFNDIPFQRIANYSNPYGETIKNTDMIESNDQVNELTAMYTNNNLVSFRPGIVEISFALSYKFNIYLPNHLRNKLHLDKYIKENAGLYYKNNHRRAEVLQWWTEHFVDLIQHSTYTSCYNILHTDLVILSVLDRKSTLYNYEHLHKIILKHSEGKKILYVGNAVDSIRAGYDRGLQNVWKFPVSNFSMYYLKTPQTTPGMVYPHDTMIETCDDIIHQIDYNYSDFDTAIFGCGAYGSSLINILRKKYPQKNLIYLGSDCFTMFGVKINFHESNIDNSIVNTDALIDIVEYLQQGCRRHPEKKYWKQP